MLEAFRLVNNMPIITLLTDFGLRDPYVAEMKAVIISICQKARIVDISHEIEKFNVRMGAFILAQAAPHFPKGTIHVAVVDPGVGTARKPIIVETERAFYVGPDNGLLMLAARNDGVKCVYEIANPKYMLRHVSRTFHGRDIFSPAAAHLANGVDPSEFGPIVENPIMPSFLSPKIMGNEVVGEILHIDRFGNLITNIPESMLKALGISEGMNLQFKLGDREVRVKLCSSYNDVQKGSLLSIVGGTGFLEISINQGNASCLLNMKIGDRVILIKPKEC